MTLQGMFDKYATLAREYGADAAKYYSRDDPQRAKFYESTANDFYWVCLDLLHVDPSIDDSELKEVRA